MPLRSGDLPAVQTLLLGPHATLVSVSTRGEAVLSATLEELSEALSAVHTTWTLLAIGCPLAFATDRGGSRTTDTGNETRNEALLTKGQSRHSRGQQNPTEESTKGISGSSDIIKLLGDLTTGPRPRLRNILVLTGHDRISHLTHFSDRPGSVDVEVQDVQDVQVVQVVQDVQDVQDVHDEPDKRDKRDDASEAPLTLGEESNAAAQAQNGWYELSIGPFSPGVEEEEAAEDVEALVAIPGQDPYTQMLLGPRGFSSRIVVPADGADVGNHGLLRLSPSGELQFSLQTGRLKCKASVTLSPKVP
mmetsp:Transcript_12815/g.47367  ORF Transcript_12815/g.47367 Transcript_12815/m.47367 type:complete len:304 (-) Transcript_12815:1563-2474(-)